MIIIIILMKICNVILMYNENDNNENNDNV